MEGEEQAVTKETVNTDGQDQQTRENDMANTATECIMWLEGEEGVVKLPVDEPEVFAGYVQLLYTGLLPMYEEPQNVESVQADAGTKKQDSKRRKIAREHKEAQSTAIHRSYEKLVKIYIFCEKIQDITAKRTLLAAFVENSLKEDDSGSHTFPDATIVRSVYGGTLTSDPLRAWLVDCYVIHGHGGWSEDKYTNFPHEFLHDVMKRMYAERGAPKDRGKTRDVKYYQDKLLEVEAAADSEHISDSDSESTDSDSDSGSGSDSGSSSDSD